MMNGHILNPSGYIKDYFLQNVHWQLWIVAHLGDMLNSNLPFLIIETFKECETSVVIY
jgi:hypothetical protein